MMDSTASPKWRPRSGFRAFRPAARRILAAVLAAGCLGTIAERARGEDLVPVPGGPAAMRRLFGLDPARSDADFFFDLHELLLFAGSDGAGWSKVVARKRAAAFAEDLADWRRRFGNPARFSPSSDAGWHRCRLALEWLGFAVQGSRVQRNPDPDSARRQEFLDILGVSTSAFLADLRAKRDTEVASSDATAPLPFGLAAWQEGIPELHLTAENAFLVLLENVRASRMLVALGSLDPETRESLRVIRAADGRGNGWTILYDRANEPFFRYPEALEIREGQFVLPGGAAAEPIWTNLFGVAPARPDAFLEALFTKDSGKGAYVVDALRPLRDEEATRLLFGEARPGPEAVARFRKIYDAIDPAGENHQRPRRDPYDFSHLARWLASPGGLPALASGDPKDGRHFPESEEELAELVARTGDGAISDDEKIRRLFGGGRDSVLAAKSLLVETSLLARNPSFAEPGLRLLLDRGLDRFAPAYALFADAPGLPPELARRYLFALDRLDRRAGSRDGELAAALFQGDVRLLGMLSRSRGLTTEAVRELLSALLDLPLFAREDVRAAEGEAELFDWLSDGLLGSLPPVPAGGDESSSPDDRLMRALVGESSAATLEWRGGLYRFDPAEDEISRRRAFREKQRLTTISDLDAIHRARAQALDAVSRGDAEGHRAAVSELLLELRVDEGSGESGEADERLAKAQKRAREAAAEIEGPAATGDLSKAPERLFELDALVAERHLEALLGHVYAASARDPEDLYYQDPSFVRRHSFRRVEKGGQAVQSPFTPTALVAQRGNGGFRVAGSLFGLTEVLGLLHADQLPYGAGERTANEEIRTGLVAPVWEMGVSRLDEDSLELVAASCRSAEELAAALAGRPATDRLRIWRALARDLLTAPRLARLASRDTLTFEDAATTASPSDLYRIGRRLVAEGPPLGAPETPALGEARAAAARQAARGGREATGDLRAEFGPRAEAYSGAFHLSDREMPAYERLAAYRRPEMFSERIYDLKIVVACRMAERKLPAQILPIVLPAALDAMLVRLRMSYPYDWGAAARAAVEFSQADLDRIVDHAVDTGRLIREENGSFQTGGGK